MLVAVIVLAVWLIGVSVADNIQSRESLRWWQRVHGSEPEQAGGSAVGSEVPGQRRDGEALTAAGRWRGRTGGRTPPPGRICRPSGPGTPTGRSGRWPARTPHARTTT